MTQPIKSAPVKEIGHAGLVAPPWSFFGSDESGEDAPQLRWPLSVQTYHRMRSDAQVDALTKAVLLPILKLNWRLNPNGARDEVVEQLSTDLNLPIRGAGEDVVRGRKRFNFREYLRLALLAPTVYGHMFFEQVGTIVGTGPDMRWRLRKLAQRMPQSIQEIKVARDGGLEWIRQWDTTAGALSRSTSQRGMGLMQAVPIPVSSLAAYVWEREGSNWTGRSMLRPVYRHWLLKDRLLRIDAIKNERFGTGIPTGTAAQGGDPADYQKMAAAIRASEDSGVGLPYGASIGVEGIRGTLPDTLGSIRYQDEAMARSFLAMFMQLGSTEFGSRALGESFVDFFTDAEAAISNWFMTTTNEYVIEDYVDWNWGEDEQAPLLEWEENEESPLGVTDLVGLIDAGILTVDDELDRWARARWKLPDADPLTARQAVVVQPPAPTPVPPAPSTPAAKQRAPRAASQTLGRPIGHRDPSAVEAAAGTNFTAIQQQWEKELTILVSAWADVRAGQIDDLVAQIETLVDAGNAAGLASLWTETAGADEIYQSMRVVVEQAISGACAEATAQGVATTLVNIATLDPLIREHAEATATLLSRGISETAARQSLLRYGVNTLSGHDVAEGVREHLMALSDVTLNDLLGGALTQSQNMGRTEVFSQNPATYYASELLDQNTCEVCAAADETEYATLEEATAQYPTGGNADCLGGARCRGTLIAVYSTETNPTVE